MAFQVGDRPGDAENLVGLSLKPFVRQARTNLMASPRAISSAREGRSLKARSFSMEGGRESPWGASRTWFMVGLLRFLSGPCSRNADSPQPTSAVLPAEGDGHCNGTRRGGPARWKQSPHLFSVTRTLEGPDFLGTGPTISGERRAPQGPANRDAPPARSRRRTSVGCLNSRDTVQRG